MNRADGLKQKAHLEVSESDVVRYVAYRHFYRLARAAMGKNIYFALMEQSMVLANKEIYPEEKTF